MPSDKDKLATQPAYGGPERRTHSADEDVYQRRVRFDDKGNPVWEIRVTAPRRREDDDTVNLLKCIDPDSLTLADEESD